jgi:alginate O-acetyltransferase complex protein AlgI
MDAMLFCSSAYLVFFAFVFILYWALPWHRVRVWLLLIASFGFYASWNSWLACLILVSTSIDYALARGIDDSQSAGIRKLLLTINIAGNLGLLCYFKYVNFFLDTLQTTLSALGAEGSMPLLAVILPVGISFYTFEAISYMVDVYRRKMRAERSLPNFVLFITFFPHLVAGPIVRARDFLPQVTRPKRWDWARMNLGAQYFLMGLFKKLAIADRMAAFVDPIFEAPTAHATHNVWIAVFAYALQIYCDFSGYCDMAIGSAHLLGYKLPQNFDMPYLASNMSEFWRRWHMSLSSWLRDYLFIPLGGSRGALWHTARNLMITMTLGGLWHGASWNFAIWGLLHGLLLISHRLFRGFVETRPALARAVDTALGSAASVVLTFLLVCFTWIPFRAQTLEQAGLVVHRMFVPAASAALTPVHGSGLIYTYLVVALSHWVGTRLWFKHATLRLPPPVAGLGYALQLTVTLLLAPASGKAFIYFQF